ncbi:MAG: nicotinate-nucleotide adenylyltransferase [Lysobacteraceae bacterium]
MSELRIVFGGTFDPPHNGHIALALAASERFDSDVWLMPNGRPRHRGGPQVDAENRAELVELAIADHPQLHLDRREIGGVVTGELSGYSVDTLEALRRELGPEQPIAWLLGADSFRSLQQWHRWERLGELTHFIVVERPGAGSMGSGSMGSESLISPVLVETSSPSEINDSDPIDPIDLDPELAAWANGRWRDDSNALANASAGLLYRLPFTPRGESATTIRQRLANGDDCRDALPAAVADAIRERGLYQSSSLEFVLHANLRHENTE